MITYYIFALYLYIFRWKEVDNFTFVFCVSLSFNHLFIGFVIYPGKRTREKVIFGQYVKMTEASRIYSTVAPPNTANLGTDEKAAVLGGIGSHI